MKYGRRLFLFIFVLNYWNIYSQLINPELGSIIRETNLDTLVKYVNILTGEDSVTIDDKVYLIISRASDHPHSDSAADFIKQTLSKLDLLICDQKYSLTGRNILGIQTGTEYPDQEYIICAHYDAVTSYCADDNASSVAAVLEAARILSKYRTKHTIIFAFWDQEEVGRLGSDHGSFWSCGFSAIVFGEAFFSGDPNPYYHTTQDRIDKFNLEYYHKLSKLVVATISHLAIVDMNTYPENRITQTPCEFKLYQNFPNPFNVVTRIPFDISKTCFVSLNIYDILGNHVKTLVNKEKSPGEYEVIFNAKNLSCGIYLCELETGNTYYNKKMTLIK